MRPDDYIVSDINDFRVKLNEAVALYEKHKSDTPVQLFAYETLTKLENSIVNNELSQCKGVAYGFYRIVGDMQEGDVFLYSNEGRKLMTLLNYFDDNYFPQFHIEN